MNKLITSLLALTFSAVAAAATISEDTSVDSVSATTAITANASSGSGSGGKISGAAGRLSAFGNSYCTFIGNKPTLGAAFQAVRGYVDASGNVTFYSSLGTGMTAGNINSMVQTNSSSGATGTTGIKLNFSIDAVGMTATSAAPTQLSTALSTTVYQCKWD